MQIAHGLFMLFLCFFKNFEIFLLDGLGVIQKIFYFLVQFIDFGLLLLAFALNKPQLFFQQNFFVCAFMVLLHHSLYISFSLLQSILTLFFYLFYFLFPFKCVRTTVLLFCFLFLQLIQQFAYPSLLFCQFILIIVVDSSGFLEFLGESVNFLFLKN